MGIFPDKKHHRIAGLLLLFVLIGILSYWPSFFGGRIWDDHFLIGRNPFFRSPALIWECYQHWMYPFSDSTYFRPTQHVSYMWDYWAWGETLFGYHLTNVCIHAGAAFLLAFLFRRIVRISLKTDTPSININLLAGGAALVWLVHPIHHAGVAYISGRADSLAALFALGAWLMCERAIEAHSQKRTIAISLTAAFLGWLALSSKEIALTWFGLFAVYHIFLRTDRKHLHRLLPLLGAGVLVAIYAVHRSNLPHMGGVAVEEAPVAAPFINRVTLMLKALGDYASLIFFPVNLHMERTLGISPNMQVPSGSWLNLHGMLILPLGIAALAIGIWLCTKRSPDRKLYRFAACWFLLGFLPISNLFPLNAQVAEHWIYMPSAAVILITVKWLLSIPILPPSARTAVVGGLCALLIAITHGQSRYWIEEETFFRETMARGGDTSRARANLARVLESKGDPEGAEKILKEAIAREPNITALRSQLGSLLTRLNRANEAAEFVNQGSGQRKRSPIPWTLETTQIRILLAAKKLDEAQKITSATLARWPLAWDLVLLQARIYQQTGANDKAIEILSGYVDRRWWHYKAVTTLAQHLAGAGRDTEAIEKYKLAARLDIRAPKPWEQIAALQFRQQQYAEALRSQTRAVDRSPDSIAQREALSQMYAKLGRREEAGIERMILPSLREKAKEQTQAQHSSSLEANEPAS